MASGMEIMLGQLLKNMGVDAEAIMSQGSEAMVLIQGFNGRLSALETAARNIENKLDDVLHAVMTTHDRTGILPAGETSLGLHAPGGGVELAITEFTETELLPPKQWPESGISQLAHEIESQTHAPILEGEVIQAAGVPYS